MSSVGRIASLLPNHRLFGFDGPGFTEHVVTYVDNGQDQGRWPVALESLCGQ